MCAVATHPPAGRNQCAKRAHNSWPASERERARSAPSHTPHSPRSILSTCLAKSGRRRVAGARLLAGGGDAPCWPRTTVSKSGMCTAHLLACEQAPGTHAARPINTRIPTTSPNSSTDQTLGVTAVPGRVCWRRWAGAPKPAAPADVKGACARPMIRSSGLSAEVVGSLASARIPQEHCNSGLLPDG